MATVSKGRVFVSGETVTPAKLNELVDNATVTSIVDADVSASAAIALSKLATGALPTAITVASANLVDGTIVNADISSTANISASKLADGAIVKVLQNTLTTVTTTTAQIPSDNTRPQISEGTEILSQAITPASNTNKVLCRISVPFSSNSAIRVGVALFRAGTTDAIASSEGQSLNSGQVSFEFLDSPASASSVTYSVRVGSMDGVSTVGVCGQASSAASRLHGGSCMATLTLLEIKAS